MKLVNALVVFILSAFLVTSCQKELDFGNFESAGSLKSDASFDCLPSSVHGIYTENSVLTDTNYIEVQVNTTLSGNYTIQSDTVNGYYFRGTGNFNSTGLNTVRLYGSGTPELPGPNSFIIRYDSTFCIIDVDVIAAAGAAEYTFAGSGGTCTGGSVAGTYMVGTAATSSNTSTISVDVIALGSYSITTGEVNGVTFNGTGTFTTLGPQSVVLTATGTPLADGSFNYPVSGGTNLGCAFSVTALPAAPPAVFTLGGSPNACTTPTIVGTYQAGIAVIAQNTATITVDVTTVGAYSISTTTTNGITFNGSGIFSTTGPQQVVLTATGTPVASGPFSFTVTGGSSTCTFPLTFDAAPTGIFHCKVNGVYYNFGNAASASYITPDTELTMTGNNIGGITFVCGISLAGTGQTIAAGTFINDLATIAQGNIISGLYTDINSMSWSPAVTAPVDAFTITITNLTPTNVQGTFSGPLHDQFGTGGNTVTISEGEFDLPIN